MFSVVVCSHTPARQDWVRAQYAQYFPDAELVIVDDARSLADGYSRGFERTTRELVIFSHDDIEFVVPDMAARIADHLRFRYDLIGVAGTRKLVAGRWDAAGDPHCFLLICYPEGADIYSVRYAGNGEIAEPAQALDGVFWACRRSVPLRVGFDVNNFDGFHLYDLDFTYRAHIAGFRIGVCRDLPLIHFSMGQLDAAWQKYSKAFEQKFAIHPQAPCPLHVRGHVGNKSEIAAFCSRDNLRKVLNHGAGV